MPPNYLTSQPRVDPEASKPIMAGFQGAKLLTPKEQVAKPLVPVAVKMILDRKDVDVCARNNNSQKGDETSFPITWAILVQSQASVCIAVGEADTGLQGKIVELKPPFEFVEESKHDPENARHRIADRAMGEDAVEGEFNTEVFAWARHMYRTLGVDVCGNRSIVPRPPSVIESETSALENGRKSMILAYLKENFVVCDPKDAAKVVDVNKRLKEIFDADASMLANVNLSKASRGHYRGGPKAEHFLYYKWQLVAGSKAVPVKFRD